MEPQNKSFLDKACQYYVNHVIPADAQYLKRLLKENGENSKQTGWSKIHTSILLPRLLKGPLTAPASLGYAAFHTVNGLTQFTIEVLDGHLLNAVRVVGLELLTTMRYIAITVAQIAYAVIGLFAGSSFYSKFIPATKPAAAVPEQVDLEKLKNEHKKSIEDLNRKIQENEGTIKDLNSKLDQDNKNKKTIEDLDKQIKEDQKQITELKLKVDQDNKKQQEIEQLTKQIKEAEKQITLLNSKVDEDNKQLQEIEKLTKQNKILTFDINKLNDQINVLTKLSQDIRTTTNQRIDNLTKQLDEKTKENQKNNNNSQELFKQNKELTSQLFSLQKELKEIEEELKAAKQNIKDLQSLNLVKEDDKRKLEENFKTSIAKYSSLKEKHQELYTIALRMHQQLNPSSNPTAEPFEQFLTSSMTPPAPVVTSATTTSATTVSTPSDQPAETPSLNRVLGNVWWAANRFIDIGRQLIWDAKDAWKDHRYEVALDQITKLIGKEDIEALKALENPHFINTESTKLREAIRTAIGALTSPELFRNVREQKRMFIESLTDAIDILERNNYNVIDKKNINQIYAICTKFMTAVDMLPFNYQMALYVASKGNPQIVAIMADPDAPLHQKLEGLLQGIANADQAYKAPMANLIAAKGETIYETYRPLNKDNMPSKIAKMTYRNETTGKTLTIQEYRTGIPVKPRTSDKTKGDKSWEMEGIETEKILRGMLRDLKRKNEAKKGDEQKEKLLIVLHLNPKHYNTETDSLNHSTHADDEKGWLQTIKDIPDSLDLKQREARWIYLYRKFAKDPEFKDVLSVALVPMDGDWLKVEIEYSSKDWTLTQMKQHLSNTILQKGSPYILPNMTQSEKTDFVNQALDKISDRYFANFKGDVKLMNKEQKLAFVGLFDAQLIEALQIKEEATYVQRNCKDAVDRTMALVGAELMDRYLRLGMLYVQSNIEKIMGTICGPALGILKRELLKERQPVLLATASFLDQLKTEKVALGPVPNFNGYQLTQIEMGQDDTQSLYPAPASADTETAYTNILKFESEHPFAVQRKLSFDIAKEEMGSIDTIILEMLNARYKNLNLNYQVSEKETKASEQDNVITIAKQYVIHQADSKKGKEIAKFEGVVKIVKSDNDPYRVEFEY